ncbi:hypothetical protein B9Z55_005145 [Caenorhabditis nigoni]|uniref:Uncharacterized protein n=1 Tax=Caenorhabditis nigoni TaxID=1611254 RepID=A0A2G5UZL7_9PELO|nr:hypothetical protein B9Z55_005145 [Caenorhabditis nigoni]
MIGGTKLEIRSSAWFRNFQGVQDSFQDGQDSNRDDRRNEIGRKVLLYRKLPSLQGQFLGLVGFKLEQYKERNNLKISSVLGQGIPERAGVRIFKLTREVFSDDL